MGEAALVSSHRYDPEPIVARYESLFTELAATRARRSWTRTRSRAASWARRRARVLRRALSGRPRLNNTRPAGP
jgi:hypothetical protein